MRFLVVNGKQVPVRPKSRAPVALRTPTVALPPDPDRFRGRCVAVTSLSPNPAKQQRQRLCLQSWQDIGLPIISVNTSREIARHKWTLRNLSFIHCNAVTTEYERQTQRVSTLIDVGCQAGLPFLLINSDIEIHGDPQLLSDAIDEPEKLTIGIRWNHEDGSGRHTAKREQWGLDAFLMTPAMAATVPALPFGIGKPVWDYWVPQHFRSIGLEFHWIKKPFFFHEKHPLAWSQKEWDLGARWMHQQYGVKLTTDSAEYRKGLSR